MDLRNITEFLRDMWNYIVIILIVVIIFTFVVAFQPVAGNSMHPNLKEGNVIAVSKFAYKLGKPKRNDIVVLKDKNNKSFVKRIIGLPGEKIEYLDNYLYIDGDAFKEKFLGEDIVTSSFLFEDICSIEDCPKGVIPADMYLVMGDNRPQSDDSRNPEFGLVSKKQLKGKMLIRIWPLNQFGKV